MVASEYSPFETPLEDISTKDLSALNEVREGWFVEYKKEAVNAKALAKEVSAFANTYGGWLFIGIEEADKVNPVAGSFSGIPLDDCHLLEQRLRQGIASHLSHSPYFESRTLHGPSETLGLPEGNGIVVVEVPSSISAPHVHSDGGIYRRVGEGSEPQRENDRFQIEQLFRRKEEAVENCKIWVNRKPELSESENQSSHVRILFDADPTFSKSPRLGLSDTELIECLRDASDTQLLQHMPFDNVFYHPAGIIARQAKNNEPSSFTVTIKIYRDLRMELLVPIPRTDHVDDKRFYQYIDTYKHFSKIYDAMNNHDADRQKIADLTFLSTILYATAGFYRYLLRRSNWSHGYSCKAQVFNIWRVMPFIDTQFYVDWVTEYGMPLPQNSDFTSPIGDKPESFLNFYDKDIPADMDEENRKLQINVTARADSFIIISLIMQAFGLPDIIYINKKYPTYTDKDVDDSWSSEFMEASDRAQTIYSASSLY